MVGVGGPLFSSVVVVDTEDSFARYDGTGAGSAHSSTADSFARHDAVVVGVVILHCS